jgi:hypothetical protein
MDDEHLPSAIDRMQLFIDEFRALRLAAQEMRLTTMAGFLALFAELDQRQRTRQVDFNLFSLFEVETDEVRHSRFLAWLLDAGSGHGQGNLFLQAFAEACRLNIPPDALGRYHVRTEFSGAEAIIDILVCKAEAFLIYLENKVLASEGYDQLNRELRDMRRLGRSLQVPRARQFAIFLTPDGRAPVSGDVMHWQSISYSQLARAFEKVLPAIASAKVRDVVKDWVETVSVFGGVYELVV